MKQDEDRMPKATRDLMAKIEEDLKDKGPCYLHVGKLELKLIDDYNYKWPFANVILVPVKDASYYLLEAKQ